MEAERPVRTAPAPIEVLLVDDQTIVAEGVRRALATVGGSMRLHHHDRCADAVAAAEALRPDVILQDLILPDGDGLELVRRYREQPALAGVPIIVLTTIERPQCKAEAFAAGANDYLVKLPAAEELTARVTYHANSFRAARERDAALEELRRAEQALQERNRELDDLNRLLAMANETIAGDARDQRDLLTSARKLGQELLHIHDVDLLVERIVGEAEHIAPLRACGLLLRDGSQPRYSLEAGRSADGGVGLERVIVEESSEGLVGAAIRTGEEVHKEADSTDPPLEPAIVRALGCEPHVALALPLRDPAATGPALAILLLLDPTGPAGHPRPFTEEEELQLRHVGALATLALERARLTRSMVLRMVRMAELRDPTETGAHVQRVAGYSLAIFDEWARRRRLSESEARRQRDRLQIAALLHDVGKVGVADAILGKPGPLDAEERAAMERHTEIGGALFGLFRSEFDEAARDVALGHHERWDGRGYPGEPNGEEGTQRKGRSGESIPLFARIVAVADVYDALTSRRSYKEPWPEARVLEHLREEAGRHFDPELIQIALERAEEFQRIRRRVEAREGEA